MSDAATIMRANGLGLVDVCIQAAQLENVELAVACTVYQNESSGRNVWGGDKVATGGIYRPGDIVTKDAYLRYRTDMKAGRIGRQGVGPCQCTGAGYQDTADALGGCWDPLANSRSGFRGIGRLIAQFGVRGGAQRYNGSGPMAVAYGVKFYARYLIWKSRLSGASIPTVQEDDMAAVPQSEWNDVHAQETRAEPPWAGGYTDEKNSAYDAFMYAKRANVEVHQCWLAVQALTAKVDALVAALAKP